MQSYEQRLHAAESLQGLCELVEKGVSSQLGLINPKVTVQFETLGQDGNTGAFYAPYFNAIVVNKNPLRKILEGNVEVAKEYLFYILCHEYIHSLGVFNEERTRHLTAWVCYRLFGREHRITRFATGEQNPFELAEPWQEHILLMVRDQDRVHILFLYPGFSAG